MSAFSTFRHITIGQYLPYGSLVHRLDPRAKILMFLALVAAVSFADSYVANLILLIALLSVVYLSRVPIGYALTVARGAMRLASHKLPINTRFVLRETGVAVGSDSATGEATK